MFLIIFEISSRFFAQVRNNTTTIVHLRTTDVPLKLYIYIKKYNSCTSEGRYILKVEKMYHWSYHPRYRWVPLFLTVCRCGIILYLHSWLTFFKKKKKTPKKKKKRFSFWTSFFWVKNITQKKILRTNTSSTVLEKCSVLLPNLCIRYQS